MHVDKVPLRGEVTKEITAVVDVTTRLETSLTTSTGWTAKIVPEAPAVGEVLNDKLYATFVILKGLLVAEVRPGLDAVRVRPAFHEFP